MKLKYYLRGLGIGIVVTAIIMTVAHGNKQTMTDEEVISRAKELGMIENTLLKDIDPSDNEADETTQADDGNGNEPVTDTENDTKNDTETEVETETETETAPPDTEQKDVVAITIVGGDSSWTVAKRMEEAGLIDSAKDFDAHLCRYGYDKKISVGTYNIPKNATHEEMAKIITKTD